MGKVILICGKICSGKTYYANEIKKKENAIILSVDEVTYDLINNKQGICYDDFVIRVKNYLTKKAIEIAKSGANVILDWGFWTNKDRTKITEYLKNSKLEFEWHYIDIDDETWHKNINIRNEKVLAGQGGSDFYVDEGLFNKLISEFEEPNSEEMDIIHKL